MSDRSPVGMSIFVLLLCINFGIIVVAQTGMWASPQEAEDSPSLTSYVDTSILLYIGVAGIVGGVAAGLVGGNPILFAAISSIGGFITGIFIGTTQFLYTMISPLEGTSFTVAASMVAGFIGFSFVMLILFMYQLATGGWKSYV